MKILVVSQYFWPENLRINDLAAELANRGHRITVLTGYPNYPEGRIYPEFQESPSTYSTFKDMEIVRVPVVARRRGSHFWLALNYISFFCLASVLGPLKLRGRQFDVIFVFGPSPITACIPAIALRGIKKIPIAFWVLDLWPESLSAVGIIKSPKLLAAFGIVVKHIYKRCDLILAQSKSFMEAISKYCRATGKIKYFPSWSEDLFDGQPALKAAEVASAPGVFTVLFAGNIGDAQGFPTILEAASKLRGRHDIRWVVVGDGRMADWVKAQIAERNLQQHVFMPGRFPLERMGSFFAHADALLVSLKESDIFSMTIPGKLQTYLSSGLPLIGAIDGEGAQIIRESGAGFACKASDADALAAAVWQMSQLSEQERRAMGAAGKAYYDAQFDKTRLMDRLETLLSQLQLARN